VDLGWSKLAHSPMLDMQTPAGRLVSPLIFKDDVLKSADATISLPLYTSGLLSSRIAAERAGESAAVANARRAEADVGLTVAVAYLDVLRARGAAAVAHDKVAALAAHHQLVQRLYDHEGVPKTDLLGAEVQLENARSDALQADNVVLASGEAYNDLLGQPLDRKLDLSEPTETTPIGRGEVHVLTDEAWSRRSELQALAAEGDAFRASARAERADGLPHVALRAGWQHLETQILDRNDVASIGIGVQWKLFDSGQTAARVAAMNTKARSADRELAELRVAIQREVAAAVRGLEEARLRLEAGQKAAVSGAENLHLATRMYETGLTTNAVVLETTAAAADARLREVNARYDLTLADYRLRHALGRL
jgi:outer membrane protein TolC